jgi:hypothetical protein
VRDFEIKFTSVQQIALPQSLQPAPGTCKVLINFNVTGPKSGIDNVQVYAVNAVDTISAGLGDVVDTVDMQIQEYQYTSLVDLQAGAKYTLALCPRSISDTDGTLDDQTEGEYWESVCVSFPFTTRTSQAPPISLTPPVIVSVQAVPKSLHQSNGMRISWISSIYYDAWNVTWMLAGLPVTRAQSPELDFSGASGSYFCPPLITPTRGEKYSIQVEGGQSLIGGGHNWSGWSAPVQVTAIATTNSLRAFLTASGVHGANGIKTFLPAPPVGLRSVMGI